MRKIPYFISAILLIVLVVVYFNICGHRGHIPHGMIYGTEAKWFLLASFCGAGLFFSIGVLLDILHNLSREITQTPPSSHKTSAGQ